MTLEELQPTPDLNQEQSQKIEPYQTNTFSVDERVRSLDGSFLSFTIAELGFKDTL